MPDNRWLLPEGIEEILPPQAARLEQMRRELLDLFRGWGYELILPPVIEFLDSLLTGSGRDLDLQTFKLTDQGSGRLMGVRADITPQAARIDAHQLKREAPTRLCYLGTVLRTRSDGFGGSRAPLQIGAELFGHFGLASDCEIICLMMETLRLAGVADVHLDLGHVGIFRGLSRQAGLDERQELALFEALQRKALPEIRDLLNTFGTPEPLRGMLGTLAELNGPDALQRAEEVLAEADPPVREALQYLQRIAALVHDRLPEVPVHYDLAELRAYHYQTGVVFAAFVPGSGQEIARGGRYDHIGESFGRARPATGFSADLLTLMRRSARMDNGPDRRILAPAVDDAGLRERVAELRSQGDILIYELPGQSGDGAAMGCTARLIADGGDWRVEEWVPA
ncbi:MAG: ATP phosphoribosyltransferase regulatory subunit [Gammaproteobacteria bacterium]|nr:ATP phosphoribosyltransferase regulatory subunit [Gammaproteobacteria bacterium]MBU1653634.1 ATP phosphoribosyltransferase regulatory subunit [Gammaproteobacteria bacterium]MBU1962746.1 ATP phosphoribosyltransferase regulatory subunit [Gammaproteobacteria bacterium]